MKKAKEFVHRVRPGWNDRRVPNPVPRKGPSEQWLFKQAWQAKRMVKVGKARVPLAAQKSGVKVIDANSLFDQPLATPEHWEVPVPDDPTFGKPITRQDHPDYRQDFIYNFGPRQRIVHGEDQACLLTKTQLFRGLPERIANLTGRVQVEDQDELAQRYILQAHKWDPMQVKLPKRFNRELPGWKFKREWGITAERFGSSLLYKLLGLCQRLGAHYPDLLQDRCIRRDPYVVAQYHFLDKPVQVQGVSQAMVSASKPVQPFATGQQVQDTVGHQLPDLHPLSPMVDLSHQHIWRPENNTGWLHPRSHAAPHTLVIRDPIHSIWRATHKNALAIMFCFAHCLAYAKQKYGWDVQDLPEPVSMHCVSSDGISFSFVTYQLNTLDYGNLEGIKNLVWVDSENALFQKIVPRRGMLRMTRYEDYDPQVLEKLIALYVDGADLTRNNMLDATSKEAAQAKLDTNILQ